MARITGTMRGMALMSWRPPTRMVRGRPSRSTVRLLPGDGRDGLHRGGDHDVVAVADAGQDAAGAVGGEAAGDQGIVVFGAQHPGRGKAGADLHPFDRAHGHHGLGQDGVQLVEDRLAQARRAAPHPHLHHAAQGVSLGLDLFHPGVHGRQDSRRRGKRRDCPK